MPSSSQLDKKQAFFSQPLAIQIQLLQELKNALDRLDFNLLNEEGIFTENLNKADAQPSGKLNNINYFVNLALLLRIEMKDVQLNLRPLFLFLRNNNILLPLLSKPYKSFDLKFWYSFALMSNFKGGQPPQKNRLYLEKNQDNSIHYKTLSDRNEIYEGIIEFSELEEISGDQYAQLDNENIESFEQIKTSILKVTSKRGHTPVPITQFDFYVLIRSQDLARQCNESSHVWTQNEQSFLQLLLQPNLFRNHIRQWLRQLLPDDAEAINAWCSQKWSSYLRKWFIRTNFKRLLLVLKEKGFTLQDIQVFLEKHDISCTPLLLEHIKNLHSFSKEAILSESFSISLLQYFSSLPPHLKKEALTYGSTVFDKLRNLQRRTGNLRLIFKKIPCFSSTSFTLAQMCKIPKEVYKGIKASINNGHVSPMKDWKDWTIGEITQLTAYLFEDIPQLLTLYQPSEILSLKKKIKYNPTTMRSPLRALNLLDDDDLKWILAHLNEGSLNSDAFPVLWQATSILDPHNPDAPLTGFEVLTRYVKHCRALFKKPFSVEEFITTINANSSCLNKIIKTSVFSYQPILEHFKLEALFALEKIRINEPGPINRPMREASQLDHFIQFLKDICFSGQEDILKDEFSRNKLMSYFNSDRPVSLIESIKKLGVERTKEILATGDLLWQLDVLWHVKHSLWLEVINFYKDNKGQTISDLIPQLLSSFLESCALINFSKEELRQLKSLPSAALAMDSDDERAFSQRIQGLSEEHAQYQRARFNNKEVKSLQCLLKCIVIDEAQKGLHLKLVFPFEQDRTNHPYRRFLSQFKFNIWKALYDSLIPSETSLNDCLGCMDYFVADEPFDNSEEETFIEFIKSENFKFALRQFIASPHSFYKGLKFRIVDIKKLCDASVTLSESDGSTTNLFKIVITLPWKTIQHIYQSHYSDTLSDPNVEELIAIKGLLVDSLRNNGGKKRKIDETDAPSSLVGSQFFQYKGASEEETLQEETLEEENRDFDINFVNVWPNTSL